MRAPLPPVTVSACYACPCERARRLVGWGSPVERRSACPCSRTLAVVEATRFRSHDPAYHDYVQLLVGNVIAEARAHGWTRRPPRRRSAARRRCWPRTETADAIVIVGGEDIHPRLLRRRRRATRTSRRHLPVADAAQIALVRAAIERRTPAPRHLPRPADRQRRPRRHARPGPRRGVRPREPRRPHPAGAHHAHRARRSRAAASRSCSASRPSRCAAPTTRRWMSLGADLAVTARSPDGHVEAVEHRDAPVLGRAVAPGGRRPPPRPAAPPCSRPPRRPPRSARPPPSPPDTHAPPRCRSWLIFGANTRHYVSPRLRNEEQAEAAGQRGQPCVADQRARTRPRPGSSRAARRRAPRANTARCCERPGTADRHHDAAARRELFHPGARHGRTGRRRHDRVVRRAGRPAERPVAGDHLDPVAERLQRARPRRPRGRDAARCSPRGGRAPR